MNENSAVKNEPAEKLAFALKEEQPQDFSVNNEEEDHVYRMFRQPYI